MFDEEFTKKYGIELDSIAEEIFDKAGTYDCHWDVLVAAASLISEARRDSKIIPNNPHMPNKYCPACGAIWAPNEILGDCPTCQCSCIPVGTVRYDPVTRDQLTVKPRITTMARKYMNCPFYSKEKEI